MRSPVDGRYWLPLGTHSEYDCPEPGAVVALDHQVWQVIEVTDLDPAQWTDRERSYAQAYGGRRRPRAVRLRPIGLVAHPDPVKAAAQDRHVGSVRGGTWNVYPDPTHYPICASCGEPMPCRERVGARMAADAVTRMGRYETAGVCPACSEPVTARQKTITFSENLEIPGGPPVTFHLRGRCWGNAADYEKRWVAADPNRRRTALSCAGHLTNHNDGTYDCTQLADCPGPEVPHPAYTRCSCPDCHARPWTQGSGCLPDPRARRNRGNADA